MPSWFPLGMPDALHKEQLTSTTEAQARASFPVKMPAVNPGGFTLVALDHVWPPHVDEASRDGGVMADWSVALYQDSAGHSLQIFQGFFAPMHSWAELDPPADSVGALDINGKSAVWVTASPALGAMPQVVNDRLAISTWEKHTDFAYVGWQDEVYAAPQGGTGETSRYYGLASDFLSVAQLAEIARSIQVVSGA